MKIIIKRLNVYNYIICCQFDFALLKALKKALKIKLPKTQYSPYFGPNRDGVLRLYTAAAGAGAQIKVKRGHVQRVINWAASAEIEIEYEGWVQENPENFAEVQFSKYLVPKDRDYQRNAVLAWLRHGYGIIKVPTRGGKTVIASEIIRIMTKTKPDIKILFLTDLVDLYSQTVEELERLLIEEVGEIKGALFNPKRVTVCMTQTMQSKIKQEKSKSMRHRLYTKFLANIDMIFVDECHDFVSDARLQILTLSKAEMICGLSGTPEKSSNFADNARMKGIVGDVIYSITEESLEERGILAESKILFVQNKIECDDHSVEYNSFIKQYVYNNRERNFLIAAMTQVCVDLGLKVLVMTRSKEHGALLASEYEFDFLSGDNDPEERKRIKQRITIEEGGVAVVVTEIWKKGITLPQAQVLINITVGKEESNVIQKRGRILGAVDGKTKALTIDLVDLSEFYLSSHAYDRVLAYEKFTRKNLDVMDASAPEFLQGFYNYVKEWFTTN